MNIVWALDPFAPEKERLKSAVACLSAMSKTRAIQVHPVHLLYDHSFKRHPRSLLGQTKAELQQRGQRIIDDLVRKSGSVRMQKLQLLSSRDARLEDALEELLQCAARREADLILVGNRCRRRLRRWRFGKFSEALLLRSSVPLLLLNVLWNPKNDLDHILFSTDFSDSSKLAYRRLLEFAKFFGSRVTLFHRTDYDADKLAALAAGGYFVFEETIENETRDTNNQGNDWAEEARRQGIHAAFFLDTCVGDSVTREILSISKKRPGVVAMASDTPATSYSVFGTITSRVTRNSPHPVWIFHRNLKER